VSEFRAVVAHEILANRRSRAPQLLIGVFVGMVAVSAVIGWITTNTVSGVYDQIRANGLTSQPNPFTDVSVLYYARNTIIYVVLVGSLMAIALGVESALRDRKAATADLVLSRPVHPRVLLGGRVGGLATVLGLIVGSGTLVSWISLSLVQGASLSVPLTARLLAFGILTWAFLVGFAAAGVLSGLYLRRETTALLAPFVGWAILAFVLPQLGTAARPVALLNPVAQVPRTSGIFHILSYLTNPLSVTEQFKAVSSSLLEGPPGPSPFPAVALIVAFSAAMTIAMLATPLRRIRGGIDV